MAFLQAKDGVSTAFQLLQFLQEGLPLKALNPAAECISSSQGSVKVEGISCLQTLAVPYCSRFGVKVLPRVW